ncbi:MAG TPA: hypothetical protein VF648_01655 [Pyrinomonadaceae bacterium]|jgi:vanadium chloroperoxidase
MQDSILFWNAVALEANRISHSDPDKREQNGPTLSSRAIAIVHLAMYDAYAGIVGGAGFPRYLQVPSQPAPPAGIPPAQARDAVAGAAYTTLVALYRTQKEFFDAQLNAFNFNLSPPITTPPTPPTPLVTAFDFGVAVGRALLALRENDMDGRDSGYMASNRRFRHRVDPDNPGQRFDSPFYGAQTDGFAVKIRHGLAAPPTPADGTNDYLNALKEVRAKGIKPELMGTLPNPLFNNRRTAEETTIGIYWAYDGANRLGTPPRLYNQIIRLVAMSVKNPGTGKINNEGDNARLFAFVNAALGDAGILAWEQKYCHDFWRPVVGIREHDESFGPGAENPDDGTNNIDDNADPFWLPFGAPRTNLPMMKNFTPNFPAYPSGHATFGAAAFHITRLFYGIPVGDRKADALFKALAFVSDELNGGSQDNQGTVRPRHVRRFKGGLWDMIIENAMSRIFLGVHWSFDAFAIKSDKPDLTKNIGGVRLGLDIAEDIWNFGGKTAPKLSPAKAPIMTPLPNTSPMPLVPLQPASQKGCANKRDKATVKDGDMELTKNIYPSGISER